MKKIILFYFSYLAFSSTVLFAQVRHEISWGLGTHFKNTIQESQYFDTRIEEYNEIDKTYSIFNGTRIITQKWAAQPSFLGNFTWQIAKQKGHWSKKIGLGTTLYKFSKQLSSTTRIEKGEFAGNQTQIFICGNNRAFLTMDYSGDVIEINMPINLAYHLKNWEFALGSKFTMPILINQKFETLFDNSSPSVTDLAENQLLNKVFTVAELSATRWFNYNGVELGVGKYFNYRSENNFQSQHNTTLFFVKWKARF